MKSSSSGESSHAVQPSAGSRTGRSSGTVFLLRADCVTPVPQQKPLLPFFCIDSSVFTNVTTQRCQEDVSQLLFTHFAPTGTSLTRPEAVVGQLGIRVAFSGLKRHEQPPVEAGSLAGRLEFEQADPSALQLLQGDALLPCPGNTHQHEHRLLGLRLRFKASGDKKDGGEMEKKQGMMADTSLLNCWLCDYFAVM